MSKRPFFAATSGVVLAFLCGALFRPFADAEVADDPRQKLVRAFIAELISRGSEARLEDYTTEDLAVTILPSAPGSGPVVLSSREEFRLRRETSLKTSLILAEEDIQVVSGPGGLAARTVVSFKNVQTGQITRRPQMTFYTFRDGKIAGMTILYGAPEK